MTRKRRAPGRAMKYRITVRGPLDRHTIEALLLEVRQLSRAQGAEITSVRIEPARERLRLPPSLTRPR